MRVRAGRSRAHGISAPDDRWCLQLLGCVLTPRSHDNNIASLIKCIADLTAQTPLCFLRWEKVHSDPHSVDLKQE